MLQRRVGELASLIECLRQHGGEYNKRTGGPSPSLSGESAGVSSPQLQISRMRMITRLVSSFALVATLFAGVLSHAQQPNYDFIITGARIVDGPALPGSSGILGLSATALQPLAISTLLRLRSEWTPPG